MNLRTRLKNHRWAIIIALVVIVCCIPVIVYPLFTLCCGIMYLLGVIFDMTYKEICVVGNIYVQGALWAISSLLPIIAATKAVIIKRSPLRIGILATTIGLASLYGMALAKLVQRYALPLEPSYDLCVRDLNAMATQLGTTYEIINIIIFVAFFVLCILGNCCLYHFINRRWCKTRS